MKDKAKRSCPIENFACTHLAYCCPCPSEYRFDSRQKEPINCRTFCSFIILQWETAVQLTSIAKGIANTFELLVNLLVLPEKSCKFFVKGGVYLHEWYDSCIMYIWEETGR